VQNGSPMPDEMKPRPTREHDHAVEVLCPSCRNPALLIGHMADGYRCRFCDVLCTVTGRFAILGPDGALPDGWWEEPADVDSAVTAALARLTAAFPGTVEVTGDA
jgi:ribosomal protein S27E